MPLLPIAIIGASCRFPGARNLAEFWALLRDGRDAIGCITDERFATRFYGHPRQTEAGKSYSWSAGLLDRVDGFDAGFFGISAREAVQIDPQQRLLLELAWEAVEDAGLTGRRLRGVEAGVYIGTSGTEYANLRYGDPSSGDAYFMTGNTLSIFANRISYVLDLKGPSLTIDTACSSSMIALHLACEDLRAGRVPAALVGGVNLLLSPFPFIGFSRAGMLSRTGRCHAFDARGDGYVRGEGGGMVLLKRLDQALADGDPVRGVILASGTNSDGRTIGLSLPSRQAQAVLLERVYREAGIDPEALGFVEAHGTGTAAGDPVEAGAIGEVLGQRRSRALPIGSVKTNLGHLEPASGMAGLLKAVLALEHRLLPRSLHFETPNPHIDFAALNIRVAAEPVPLAVDGPVLAGVSSFGFGGTNAHIVLATAPSVPPAPPATGAGLPPLLLSARSEAALRALAGAWREAIGEARDAALPALLRGAARARDHHPTRAVLLPEGRTELAAALEALAAQGNGSGIVTDTAVRGGRLAFVFSGNGAQWPGMGRDALAGSAAFRRAFEQVDEVLLPLLGWSVLERLATVDAQDIARTDVAQPLLFAIQVGIVEALRAAGIEAEAAVGHSVGEIAAAWAAGALSLEDAARLVVIRSRHQHETRGVGRMAVLGAAAEEAELLVAELGVAVEVAAINTPRSLTLAGDADGLGRLGAAAEARGWLFSMLDLDYAFHSAAMEPVRAGLIAELEDLVPGEGERVFVSTVEGRRLTGEGLDALYWWRNIRDPVRFGDAVRSLVEDGVRLFLEIGPAPVLQSYIREILRESDEPGRVLSSLTRKPAAGDPFRRIAAACHAAGYDLSASPWYEGAVQRRGLPAYPWQRERHWVTVTTEAIGIARPLDDHPLLGFRRIADRPDWVNHLDTTLLPWLADHKVEQSIVLPAAAIIEIALAAARQHFPGAAAFEVRDLEIRRAVTLESDRLRELRLRLDPDTGSFELSSRARLSDEPWARHALGRVAAADELAESPAAIDATGATIEPARLYALAAGMGLHYGPEFQRVRAVRLAEGGRAEVLLAPVEGATGFLLDPRLLDGAFQGLLGAAAEATALAGGETILLPWRFDSVRLVGTPQAPVAARLAVRRAAARVLCADITMIDGAGRPVAQLQGCWFRPVQARRRARLEDRSFRVVLRPAPLEPAPEAPTRLEQVRSAVAAGVPAADPAAAEIAQLGEAFAAAAAFEAIGALVPAGGTISVESALRNRLIAPDSGPLLGSLLRLLAAYGAAAEAETGWQLALESGLPPAVEIWRSLFYGAPDRVALTALLNHAAQTLPEALTVGAGAAVAPSAALREQLLFGGPGEEAITALVRAIEAAARDWPADRPLRILELGAGRGIATLRVLRALAGIGPAIAYLATDPDADAVAALADALEPFQDASALRWDPAAGDEGGPAQAGFDLVIGAQFLSRTAPGAAALAAMRDRLAPGGLLLLVETAPNPLWEFVLGQDPGWWRHGAGRLRDAAAWCEALAEAGFADAAAQPLTDQPWGLSLLAAGPGQIAPAAAAPGERRIRIVADEADPLCATLAARLEREGRAVERALRGRDRIAPATGAEPTLLLLLPSPTQRNPAARLGEAAGLVRELAEAGHRLWLVTRGGEALEPGEAALVGLGRTLANEAPALACRRIDLAPELASEAAAAALAAELAHGNGEPEVLLSAAGRRVPRLRRGLARAPTTAPGIRLALEEPGFLDSLRWRAAETRPPGPGEIAIEVKAAGLNFRDVMWAMGLLPEEVLMDGFAGATLGMECAGVVTAVGPDVTAYRPGDRVMAFAPAALASHAITQAHCVAPLGDGLSFAAGATVPVAFLTVLYALGRLGRLEPGETVLVHGGAGAVGLAAIQYAQHRGATIIATAGSEVKRALLRSAGVDHVLDSRSLKFADQVMALTGGEGVDVVLNSLGGEAMERSLGLMRPFGRFIELGKRDFVLNTRVGLRAVRRNVSYFAVDADELVLRRPDAARAVFLELAQLFAAGALRPLPHLSLPFAEVTDAFRLMRASGHIGKIVLVPEPALQVPAEEPAAAGLPADRTFVVAGGTSGFGLAAARWLVGAGARHLALLSRRGAAAPEAGAAVALLTGAGAENVQLFACDVADAATLGYTLAEIRAGMPPIGGVLHAAMVVEDGLVMALNAARFERVLRPKLQGALNLDRLTRDDPVALFLLFSSATTILGAPGQGSYVAANMALEALARRRQAEGRPALAVAWGPIGDVGYLAERPAARDALARRLGAVPLAAEDALACLPALIASGEPVVALADVNWSVGKSHLPVLAEPMFEAIAARAERVGGGDVTELLAGKSPEETKDIVLGVLLDEISTILRVARSSLEPSRPLSEIGMDSLMAVELRVAVERRLGAEIPTLALSESVTLASMASRIAQVLGGQGSFAETLALQHETLDETEAASLTTRVLAEGGPAERAAE